MPIERYFYRSLIYLLTLQECQRFMINEECFYQCEPSLIKYQRVGRPDAVKGVPICPDYCDRWFEACKHEQTCVQDWETGFVKVGEHYACPNTSKCNSFMNVSIDTLFLPLRGTKDSQFALPIYGFIQCLRMSEQLLRRTDILLGRRRLSLVSSSPIVLCSFGKQFATSTDMNRN